MDANDKAPPQVETVQRVYVPSNSIPQVAGNAIHDLTVALGAQPILLLVILLNVAMLSSAAWYLTRQETSRHDEQMRIIDLLARCQVADLTPSNRPH